jgi:hypothetical protein
MKITDKHGQQWQLVPVKSTKEMYDKAISDDLWYEINPPPHIAYELMLAAAPEPELPEGLEPVAWTKQHAGFTLLEGSPLIGGAALVLQSTALTALAEKDAEISLLAEQNAKMRACLKLIPEISSTEVFYEKVAKPLLFLPDLATPAINRIKAEGMREAAEIAHCIAMQRPGTAMECEVSIRAKADELDVKK